MSPSGRIAVFDLGSNSIKFLVAEVPVEKLTILKNTSSITRLGEGVQETHKLSEAVMARNLEALVRFKSEAEALNVSEWKAVATSAVRDSENREEFRRRFQKAMGFDLRILSGEEEAELIYRGVTSDVHTAKPDHPLLVIDSGGGSSEFIRGIPSRIEERISLELGCVRMTERFLKGDPYLTESIEQLTQCYKMQLEPLKNRFAATGRTLIGTGGSLSTAGAVIRKSKSYEQDSIHGMEMTVEQLATLAVTLQKMRNEERIQLGIPEKRADVITAGVMFFATALPILGARTIQLSLRGLRFGVLFDSRI